MFTFQLAVMFKRRCTGSLSCGFVTTAGILNWASSLSSNWQV
uniref:Uncharacterized protein n=1 Tax=Anguilla anguilla TaxID=7936 RepID=A0A0E9TVG3_ANGAN